MVSPQVNLAVHNLPHRQDQLMSCRAVQCTGCTCHSVLFCCCAGCCRMVITLGTGSMAITLMLFPFSFPGELASREQPSSLSAHKGQKVHSQGSVVQLCYLAWNKRVCCCLQPNPQQTHNPNIQVPYLHIEAAAAPQIIGHAHVFAPVPPAGQWGTALAAWIFNVVLFTAFLCLLLARAVCYPSSARELLEQPNQSLFFGCVPITISVVTEGVIVLLVPRCDRTKQQHKNSTSNRVYDPAADQTQGGSD